MFDYHMNLHYSQTKYQTVAVNYKFDYHMNLHYSQTKGKVAQNKISLTII